MSGASLLGEVAGLGHLNTHGLGGERGPLLPAQVEALAQLVAQAFPVIDKDRQNNPAICVIGGVAV